MQKLKAVMVLALLAGVVPVFAAQRGDFRMEVLVDGVPRPEYFARGTTYIEALKGKEYEIRLTNPYGVRVAVALSVDGLNSLDARHTDARSARKWILDPYQTIVLRGWQTSSQEARRFFFTSEQNSYGQWLGKTENLGIISAAFFRERRPVVLRDEMRPQPRMQAPASGMGSKKEADRSNESGAIGGIKQDDYAATGIGHAEDHPVTMVHMDLEDSPAAVVSVRYEYRPALLSLGIIPQPRPVDPLRRRENAQGFEYCPSPR